MKKVIVIIVIFAIAFLVYFWNLNSCQKKKQGDFIEFSGTIETTETDVSFQIGGRIKTLFVDEGDTVQKGQLIAELDDSDLLEQKRLAHASLDAAKSQMAPLEARILASREQSSAKIISAKFVLSEAQARLRQLENGSRPQEVEQARRDVEAAKTQMEYLKGEYLRAERLFREGAMPGAQRDAAKSNYEIAVAKYRQAKERLSLAREGPRREEIEAARERVRQAEAEVILAKAAALEVEALIKQQETILAQIRQAQANLQATNLQLSHAKLFSPVGGVVLVKAREAGEVVSPGMTVVVLGDLQKVWLKAYINETDLGRVKLGQPVEITTDSFQEKIYRGRVFYISSRAEFTPKNLQTKEDRVKLVYRIKVAIENLNQELKPGMIADGRIKP